MPAPPPFPDHDPGLFRPVPARTLHAWDRGTFAENLAVAEDGAVFVSLHSHRRVERIDPGDSTAAVVATAAVPLAGLAFDTDGVLWAVGGELGTPPGSVWRLDATWAQHSGAQHWCDVPDALFLNGCAFHPDGRLLVADAMRGQILAIDLPQRHIETWLGDDRLMPLDAKTPGANGIKLAGDAVLVSVTARNLILRIPIARGGAAAAPTPLAERLRADDFAVLPDGGLLIATHPAQSVLHLAPDGGRTTVAGPDEGAVGATAVALGRAPGDSAAAYVTTNGGLWAPYQGEVQPARLLRLDVTGLL